MEAYAYILCLMLALAGLHTIDHRWKLVYYHNKRATLMTILIGVSFFILWDIAGIMSGIFFSGETLYTSGLMLGKDFPVEEVFFLILLCYNTLILWAAARLRWQRT